MFGVYRYVLALCVMFSHLVPFVEGRFNCLGVYAVFSFFSLSGYLMTLVLHERYGFTMRGVTRYLANRALRIYPPYWVAMLFALALAVTMPATARLLDGHIGIPAAGDWPRHLLLLGLHWQVYPVLIPPAWSLHVEAAFYLLMGLGLARSGWTVATWALGGAMYAAYTVGAGWEAGHRYPTVAAGALPFSLGACAYLLKGRLRLTPTRLAVLAGGAVANALAALFLWGDPLLGGFYLQCLLGVALVYGLGQVDLRSASPRLRALDRAAGDLAYPIFLLHYPVAILLVAYAFGGVRPAGWRLFVAGFPAVHLAAWMLHRGIEVPVVALRRRVRER